MPSKKKVRSCSFKNLSHKCNEDDEVTSFIARLFAIITHLESLLMVMDQGTSR